MICPFCRGMMEDLTYEKITVDVCHGCGAVFFDQGELNAVAQEHVDIEAALSDAGTIRGARASGRPCPRCRAGTTEVQAATFGLDFCRQCCGLLLSSDSIRALFEALGKQGPSIEARVEPGLKVPQWVHSVISAIGNGYGRV